MRMIFSLIGLLITLAIVGYLAKSQLSAVTQLPSPATPSTAAPANITEQSKQIQTQVKDQINEAMKAAAEARDKATESGNTDKPAEATVSGY